MRDLHDLDDDATRGDPDPTPCTCSDDLVGPRAIFCGYDDFYSITLHGY